MFCWHDEKKILPWIFVDMLKKKRFVGKKFVEKTVWLYVGKKIRWCVEKNKFFVEKNCLVWFYDERIRVLKKITFVVVLIEWVNLSSKPRCVFTSKKFVFNQIAINLVGDSIKCFRGPCKKWMITFQVVLLDCFIEWIMGNLYYNFYGSNEDKNINTVMT